MLDRLLLWLGGGVVCAGVTMGVLSGAGVAHADGGSDSDAPGTGTSQTTKDVGQKPDSGGPEVKKKRWQRPNADAVKPGADADAKPEPQARRGNTGRRAQDSPASEAGTRTNKLIDNAVAAVTHKPARKAAVDEIASVQKSGSADRTVTADPVGVVDTRPIVARATELTQAAADLRPAPLSTPRVSLFGRAPPTSVNVALATPMAAQSQVTTTATRQIDVPPIISAIGTFIFGLISFGESAIEGPPKALPGSGVTVRRSTLDLGNGTVVPADWYFPDTYDPNSETPPERIIYLQHGFLARGVFYDYTASYLADATDSVVVAPTVSSNIFATDGMWLGGDQMHRAVANLFVDGNDALLVSATAAGYTQDELPQKVVLVGHSLGGGLVIDVARYMVANRDSGAMTYHQLAGVVMLDGVSFTDPVPILQAIPADIPVYNLSGRPYAWNLFGAMDHALAEVRGGQFHGAQLLGGLHSDAMVGGNPLIQFGAYLVTGFSAPRNVEGSQILAAGWINDMFAGTQTCDATSCFYGEPGTSFTIPTQFGPATGLVDPQPDLITAFLRELTGFFVGLLSHINFATDAPPAPDTSVLAGNVHTQHGLIS